MYPPNTTLKRNKNFPAITVPAPIADDLERTVKRPNPLNEIRIVAVSPIQTTSFGAWQGGAGDHYIVAPTAEFGANEVAPESILNDEYTVVEYGGESESQRIELESPAHKRQRLLTPEQQLAAAAKAERLKEAEAVA